MEKLHKTPDQVEFDGMQMPGFGTSKERFDQIRALDTTEKDIIITSYPRSCGGTWLFEVLYLLQTQGDIEGASVQHISQLCLSIDVALKEPMGLVTKDPYVRAVDLLGHSRLLRTRAHVRQLTKPITDGKAKIVVVLRNPKDMLVSYYHSYKHYAMFGEFNESFDHFFQLFKEKQLLFGDWLEFYSEYWKLRDAPNIHFVIYEDAQKDLRKSVMDLAEFLELELSKELLECICKHVNFKATKHNAATPEKEVKCAFERHDKVGTWTEVFTDEQSAELDALYGDTIKELNLPVTYKL